MTILDRMLFLSFLRAYFIVLTSTLSLYIVIDLFTNIDDFLSASPQFVEVAKYIVSYYAIRVLQYFDRLCETLSLLAAMFTVAGLQRNNELMPILSAGVSTRRVLRPILLARPACSASASSTKNSSCRSTPRRSWPTATTRTARRTFSCRGASTRPGSTSKGSGP